MHEVDMNDDVNVILSCWLVFLPWWQSRQPHQLTELSSAPVLSVLVFFSPEPAEKDKQN